MFSIGEMTARLGLEAELGAFPEVAHFIAFVKASKRGVTR